MFLAFSNPPKNPNAPFTTLPAEPQQANKWQERGFGSWSQFNKEAATRVEAEQTTTRPVRNGRLGNAIRLSRLGQQKTLRCTREKKKKKRVRDLARKRLRHLRFYLLFSSHTKLQAFPPCKTEGRQAENSETAAKRPALRKPR